MLNILMVSPSFPPDKTVACVRMNSLYNYLIKNNHSVYLITNTKSDNSLLPENSYTVNVLEGGGLKKFSIFKRNQERYVEAFAKAASENKIDIAVVSGGPFYSFAIAKQAKKLGIPCIIDFRDPWTFDIRGIKDMLSPMRLATRLIQKPYEKQAVKAASAVVTVTPGWRDKFVSLYPAIKDKFNLIENGFDDALLSGITIPEKQEISKPFCFGVFGKLFYYTEEYSHILLSAMESDGFNILQVGKREEITDSYLSSHSLALDRVKDTGFLDYTGGIEALGAADAFLIVDVRKEALGTKAYDYIWYNRPIVYVGPQDAELARLIASFENGFVCSDKSEILDAVNTIKADKLLCLDKNLNPAGYGRSAQNKKWEALFKKLCNKE